MMRRLLAEIKILGMALFAWVSAPSPHPDEPSFTSGSILAPVLISVAVLKYRRDYRTFFISSSGTGVGSVLLS